MADDDALEAGDDTALAKPQPHGCPADPTAETGRWISTIPAPRLPDGVRFLLGDSESRPAASKSKPRLPAAGAATPCASVTGRRPVLFYSDGTTSTAEIVLVNRRNTPCAFRSAV